MTATIRYGKPIDSFALKRDLNKADSITAAREASLSTTPGPAIEACPICSSRDRQALAEIHGHAFFECSSCQVAYVGNPPSDSELERIYKSEYYTNANRILLANDNVIEYRKNDVALPKVEYVLENCTTRKKSWLDIGCGVGENLSVASDKGFDCLGLEPNQLEREYGIRRFGLDIRDAYIDMNNFRDYVHSWGVISLFSILEHTRNPDAIVNCIANVQEENDNLVIEVPHFPSISAYSQISFPNLVNRMLHPPLHLFLFSIRSIELMLQRHSYEITNVWYFGQDFYEVLSTLSLFAEELNNSVLHEKMSLLMNEFQEVIDRNELSDEVLVVCRKTAESEPQ